MNQKLKADYFLKIAVTALYIISMQPWLTWQIPMILIFVPGFILLFFHCFLNRSKYILSRSNATSFLFILLGVLFFVSGLNLNGIITYIPVLLIFLIIVTLREEIKAELIPFITKWFARLLVISLCYYILFLIGVPLFHTSITHNLGYAPFDNYFLFIYDNRFMYPRFQSIFLEPGHLTMGLIPLIVVNRFNVKNKYVAILVLAELLSFSLAGYLTFIFALLAVLIKKRLKYLVLIIVILTPTLDYFLTKNQDNVLYQAIGIRLVLTDDNRIVGYNRTTQYFDSYYKNLMKTNKKWFGTKDFEDRNFRGGNQGYKVLVAKVGIIGVLFIYFIFLSFGFRYNNYNVWILVMILLLLLFQNSYPFWFAVMFSMILGPPFMISKKLKKRETIQLNDNSGIP